MGAAAWDSVPAATDQPRPALHLVPTGPDVDVGRDGVRLTRGGRLALTLVVAVVAVLLVSGLPRGASGHSARRVVTVQAGQTLSHIAARELPDLPMGTAVAEIQLANQLNTPYVHAGQQLVIPEVG
ncbi:MAG: LysM peptidoglycan-binding domain-containing protein [Dermatophilaceae bacterium]